MDHKPGYKNGMGDVRKDWNQWVQSVFFMLLNAHLEIKANGLLSVSDSQILQGREWDRLIFFQGESIGQVTDPSIPSWIFAQDAVC